MRYAELHARTYFSFLDGSSSPKELLQRAHELGHSSIAITDWAGVYGIVEARDELLDLFDLGRGKEGDAPLKLIYGAEVPFDDDLAVVIARTREGYAQLCSLLSAGRLAAEKGEFRLTVDQLCAHAGELIVLAGGPRSAAMRLVAERKAPEASARLARLREAFGDALSVELVRHLAPGDRERSVAMAAIARDLRIPVVATNDVHFHVPPRKRLHDLLRCIKEGVTIREAGRRLLPNAEAHLKSAEQMLRLFDDIPEAVERTVQIAESINFRLCDVKYAPPVPDLPTDQTADSLLRKLSFEGVHRRLSTRIDQHEARLEKELGVVAQLGYAGYFLVMRDVVLFCQRHGILCQGRGSAANSLICYALDITSVHPDDIDMLFERFLSLERNEPPDIDLDIEHERREEVLQYVYSKYGRERAGMVCEIIRYRARSAIGEVGKALGFSDEQLARLSKFLSHGASEVDNRAFTASGIDPANPMVKVLFDHGYQLIGFPRHLSIHVGGFILSDEPLSRSVPIENGRMADRTVIQWNKDDVDSIGMFKLDLLGLGMLTVLSKSFELVRTHHQRELSLLNVPENDQATYAMLQKADSVGVFQVESRAQMGMLPRLKPREFYDLVIEVAIVRPGPIQGGMVHPYLRRKEGKEKVDYPHPKLKEILHRTLGVPLFQEQVMKLATAVGGYTPGEADQLRRDMASWRKSGKMERHRERLLSNMRANGLNEEFANRVYQQLEGFGAYGFPESHAAAFAYLAYASAFLKRHFPAEFAAALINSQPMGFYSPAVIINDVRRHDVEIRPIDVQFSDWDCTLEGGSLRLGLRLVQGLGEEHGKAIACKRPFSSVPDLAHRAGIPEQRLVALAAAGAFRSLHEQRREAIWKAMSKSPGPLFDGLSVSEPPTDLPRLRPLEELQLDISYGNAFPGRHPLELIRPALNQRGILRSIDLRTALPDTLVRVAGLVITRQRPAAKGFVFVTLEDETGHTDVAVSPGAFARFQEVIRLSPALIIRGKLVAAGDARNLAAVHVAPLAVEKIPAGPSHDFH